MKIVDVRNVYVEFGNRKILENINFSLLKGEFLIIIGPNGAGKSTLLKAILGLIPFKGEVFIFGKSVNKLKRAEREKIGYVPQKFLHERDFPITVEELINLSTGRMEISSIKKKLIGELSGGQLQRVFILRALVREPLSGIDISGEKTFYELVNSLHRELGISIILVSHDVTVVNRFADKILSLVVGVVFIVFILLVFRELTMISFDVECAKARGINVNFIDALFLVLLALIVVIGTKTVGIVLISALIVIPAASARLISGSFKQMIVYSTLFGIISSFLGLTVSYYTNLPSGATISIVLSIIFILSFIKERVLS